MLNLRVSEQQGKQGFWAEKGIMTKQETDEIRRIFYTTAGWKELADCFPKFAEAIKMLPDESELIYCNRVLRDIFEDAQKRAKTNLLPTRILEIYQKRTK